MMRRLAFVSVASAVFGIVGAVWVASADPAPESTTRPPTPSELFGALYSQVAESGLYPDFKTFADAVPREAPASIMARYGEDQPRTNSALAQFVHRYFYFEEPATERLPPRKLPVEDHIRALWPILTRQTRSVPPYSSLLPLPEPFVVPGGRFTELYYWDSYFTMLGLGPREQTLRDGMLRNFAYMIRTYGHVPNGNRTYYVSRSQPPFFFEMVAASEPRREAAAFARFLPELKTEYSYWMEGERDAAIRHPVRNVVRMPDGSSLNRYWDERDTPRDEEYPKDVAVSRISTEPKARLYRNIRAAAESGWDFSSRWFADGNSLATVETTDIIPVDLNSLLFGLERAIATGCKEAGDRNCAERFASLAQRRRAAMNRYLWDEKAGSFFDYDWKTQSRRGVLSAAALYPLFVGEANAAQAHAVAAVARAKLLKPGGIVTTDNHTGQQWDAPNGWAPLQWIGVEGVERYGQSELADAIATRWLKTVLRSYAATGRLVEKYDVENPGRKGGGGEYKLQDGFGWTNGVTIALLRMCPVGSRRPNSETRHCAGVANSGHGGDR